MYHFILLCLVLLISGCAKMPSLKTDYDTVKLSNKKIHLIEEDAPEPRFFTSGREMLNDLAKLGGGSEEEENDSNLRNPSEMIERSLSRGIKKKFSITDKPIKHSFKGEEKPYDILSWAKTSGMEQGLLLDVETTDWGLERHPRSRTRYIVKVQAIMRLYDLGETRLLTRYSCLASSSELSLEESPTKYQLLKDDNALMKKLLYQQVRRCTRQIQEYAF